MIVWLLVDRTYAEAPLSISLPPWSIESDNPPWVSLTIALHIFSTGLCYSAPPTPPPNHSPTHPIMTTSSCPRSALCNSMRQSCPDSERAFSLWLQQQTQLRSEGVSSDVILETFICSQMGNQGVMIWMGGGHERKIQEEKSARLNWALNNDEAHRTTTPLSIACWGWHLNTRLQTKWQINKSESCSVFQYNQPSTLGICEKDGTLTNRQMTGSRPWLELEAWRCFR